MTRRTAIAAATLAALMLIPAPAPAAAAKLGQRTLKPGMSGKDVRSLQWHLTRLKLRTALDGAYGKGTFRNVRRLERRRDWSVDGRVQRLDAKRIKGMVRKQQARKRRRAATSSGYAFPVGDPHDYGSAGSRFGSKRSGHSHQGQDIFAPCRTPVRSVQSGTVAFKGYQASGAGYYLVIRGADGRDSVYMHLRKASWAAPGQALATGQQVGKVGQSGNASGCHLHFERWTAPGWYRGGRPYDPLPELLQWDAYS